MADAAGLTAEITSIATLLHDRIARVGEDATLRIATSQAKSVMAKLRTLSSLSAAEAISLQDAIEACPFTDADMGAVMSVVDNQLEALAGPASSGKTVYKSQQLTTPQNYMPASVIDRLKDESTTHDEAMDLITKVYNLLEIHYPSEQTKKWAMAFNLTMETQRTRQWPSYVSIYEDVQNFQSVLAAKGPLNDGAGLSVYPEKATSLPPSIYSKVYSESDPPLEVFLPRLKVIGEKHIPCRSTSKLLKNPANPAEPKCGQSSSDVSDFLKQMRQLFMTDQQRNRPSALDNGARITFDDEQLALRSGADRFQPMSRNRFPITDAPKPAIEVDDAGRQSAGAIMVRVDRLRAGRTDSIEHPSPGAATPGASTLPPTGPGAPLSAAAPGLAAPTAPGHVAARPAAKDAAAERAVWNSEEQEENALRALLNRDKYKSKGKGTGKGKKPKKQGRFAGLSPHEKMKLVREAMMKKTDGTAPMKKKGNDGIAPMKAAAMKAAPMTAGKKKKMPPKAPATKKAKR